MFPAAFTRISGRPSFSATSGMTFPSCAGSSRSQPTATPPISSVSLTRRSCRRATTATRAPTEASARASPSPRPDDAPVTTATRPVRSNRRKASGTSGPMGYLLAPVASGALVSPARELGDAEPAKLGAEHLDAHQACPAAVQQGRREPVELEGPVTGHRAAIHGLVHSVLRDRRRGIAELDV